MDERLKPLNALLGLALPHGLCPAALKDAGFDLVGLEVPVRTDRGNVVVDALFHHRSTSALLACEVKSGANIEEQQAQCYAAIDPVSLVQAAQVNVETRTRPTVGVLYVCLAVHYDRVSLGLDAAGVDVSLMTVSENDIVVHVAHDAPPPLAQLQQRVVLSGPPPTVVPFDQDSPGAAIRPAVHAELVASLAQRRPQLGVPWLAEQSAPYLSLFARQARTRLIRRVGEVARQIAAEEPTTFEFVPARGNDEAIVRILRTPEDNDPRGRTQAYQALARSGTRRRRPPETRDPNQLDLLEVVEAGDDDPSGPGNQSAEEDR